MATVAIAFPAYNEAKLIASTVRTTLSFCRRELVDDVRIIIADNASVDGTGVLGKRLAAEYPEVSYLHIQQKGKGAAIKAAWQSHDAELYVFMDADLATDLSALPDLITALKQGADMAVGSRYHHRSQKTRTITRRIISRGYQAALKLLFGLSISDAPCGFKGLRRGARDVLVPHCVNDSWFFDSELVILAERHGMTIAEIPVVWKDPREGSDKSRVNIWEISLRYATEMIRLRKRLKNIWPKK